MVYTFKLFQGFEVGFSAEVVKNDCCAKFS